MLNKLEEKYENGVNATKPSGDRKHQNNTRDMHLREPHKTQALTRPQKCFKISKTPARNATHLFRESGAALFCKEHKLGINKIKSRNEIDNFITCECIFLKNETLQHSFDKQCILYFEKIWFYLPKKPNQSKPMKWNSFVLFDYVKYAMNQRKCNVYKCNVYKQMSFIFKEFPGIFGGIKFQIIEKTSNIPRGLALGEATPLGWCVSSMEQKRIRPCLSPYTPVNPNLYLNQKPWQSTIFNTKSS